MQHATFGVARATQRMAWHVAYTSRDESRSRACARFPYPFHYSVLSRTAYLENLLHVCDGNVESAEDPEPRGLAVLAVQVCAHPGDCTRTCTRDTGPSALNGTVEELLVEAASGLEVA